MDYALVDLGVRYFGHPRAVLEMTREDQVLVLGWAHATAEKTRARPSLGGVTGSTSARARAQRFERGGSK